MTMMKKQTPTNQLWLTKKQKKINSKLLMIQRHKTPPQRQKLVLSLIYCLSQVVDVEEDEYKPSYVPEKVDSPKVQEKPTLKETPASSTFASERRNLFDDEPIEIAHNANQDGDDDAEYVPKNTHTDDADHEDIKPKT